VRGHERRAGDDEAEGDEAGADLEWAGPDGFVEDEDPSEDGGEVRGDRGEGDDLDGRPELEATGGGVEGDHAGDQRGQRPGAQQPVGRGFGVGEVLDRNVGDAEQRPGGQAEQESLRAMQDAAERRDGQQRGAEGEDRGLDGDQRRQRGVLRPRGAAAGLAVIGFTSGGATRPQRSSLAALIAVEGAIFALGAALLAISVHRRVLHRAEGMLLGLAAGALFGVSEIGRASCRERV